jgi:DNA-binding NarL/FixJ family response regulator
MLGANGANIMKTKTKVLIVDDHPIVREGLAVCINRQPDMTVCCEAQSPTEALQQIAACEPDIAIVDLAMPGGDGLTLIRDIIARRPNLCVLVLSVQDERVYASRALQAGAKGYIMKQEAADKLVYAVRHILAGQIYLSEQMRSLIIDGMVKSTSSVGRSPVEQLSDRELEVFRLLGEGLRSREIAARLHLSVKTIDTYYERIKHRLSVEHFNDLLRQAVLWVHAQEARSPQV